MFNRRKKFLIDPKFQIIFIGYTMSFSLLTSFIFYFSDHLFFSKLIEEGMAMGLSRDHIYFRFIDEQQLVLQKIFFVTTLVMVLTFFIGGILFSHKIVGPLVRLRTYIDEYCQGKIAGPLSFRKNDFFPDVAAKVNQLVQYLKDKKS